MRKKRALTSADARKVRKQGYDDALEFATLIGVASDYTNDYKAKKDVIDPSGDPHSVKGGKKKWQVFLYSLGRFESDEAFRVMNGIGDLCSDCLKSFPPSYEEYQRDKNTAKEQLRIPMVKLKDKLQERIRLKAFLNKSLFNNGEVLYLTVKHDGLFHVFLNKDVLKVFSECLEVCNSRAISAGQHPEQKVLFRYKEKNLGELEMRNDSPIHYQEMRFNMIKPMVMKVLFEKIPRTAKFNNSVLVYGSASKRFGRWRRLRPV
jgi:hypothetical protein